VKLLGIVSTLLLLAVSACSARAPAPPAADASAPSGATCAMVCARALCEGVQRGAAPWALDCRAVATSCAAADLCEATP